MTPADGELVRAIETSLFAIPGVPGELEALNIAGVRGHVAPHVPDGLVNNVGDFKFARDQDGEHA